VLFNGPIYSR